MAQDPKPCGEVEQNAILHSTNARTQIALGGSGKIFRFRRRRRAETGLKKRIALDEDSFVYLLL